MKNKGSDLSEIREKTKDLYSKTGDVHCPFFKEKVSFNSEGFNHLRYKEERSERFFADQKIRYELFFLAPEIIRSSKTLQEYYEKASFVEIKRKKKPEKVLKTIKYFAFIAILKNRKTKVIVRQVGAGKLHFWSIIPNWKTRKTKEGKVTFIQCSGDLLQD